MNVCIYILVAPIGDKIPISEIHEVIFANKVLKAFIANFVEDVLLNLHIMKQDELDIQGNNHKGRQCRVALYTLL